MKAVIFDMDGLMIDTERLYIDTERYIAKSYGKKVEDETIWKMMGRKAIEAAEIFVEDLQLGISPKKFIDIRDSIFEGKLIEELEPMAGLFEILDDLHGKFKLAIATGSPQKFLKIVLDKLNLHKYFDVLQTSDEIVNGKPHPEIYLKTVERLGVLPEDCIVLEDSSNGAMAGKRAGCYTIAVPSEYTYRQDFSFVDYEAKNLDEARKHILEFYKSY